MPEKTTSFFRKLFDIREGAGEKHLIIENVKDDADFSSARLWTLVFAIGVASVGLNINSIPVVIGAMLISPLMGPIVSIGLALSINDWGLMRRSFRNLVILTVISIFISALYFILTPITNAQSELLARTSPTIFDVLIAIFGGMAGFIGVTRAKHSNVIPGVAIATALMPPLCTVGYGISTLQPKFIFGAFYLFLINSIFICLSSLFVASFLKLPKKEYADVEKKKRVNRIITWIIFIIVTPAIYLAYTFVGQNNFNQNVDRYIESVFTSEGHVVVYKKLSYAKKEVELGFLSSHFSVVEISEFEDRLDDFNLEDIKLTIRQNDFSLTKEDWERVLDEVEGDKETITALEARLKSEQASFQNPSRLLEEAKAINNKITNIAIGELDFGMIDESDKGDVVVLVYTTATATEPVTMTEAGVITNWLSTRLEEEVAETYFIPPVDRSDPSR